MVVGPVVGSSSSGSSVSSAVTSASPAANNNNNLPSYREQAEIHHQIMQVSSAGAPFSSFFSFFRFGWKSELDKTNSEISNGKKICRPTQWRNSTPKLFFRYLLKKNNKRRERERERREIVVKDDSPMGSFRQQP
jgi:hypothetical protein